MVRLREEHCAIKTRPTIFPATHLGKEVLANKTFMHKVSEQPAKCKSMRKEGKVMLDVLSHTISFFREA